MKVKVTSCQESARYMETSRKTLETLMKTTIWSTFSAAIERRDNLEEGDRFCEELQGVNDTLGASSTLGIPGIWTRRLEDPDFLAD